MQHKVKGKPRDFLRYAASVLSSYFVHLWRKRHQDKMIADMQESVGKGELVLHADFAMNYSHNHPDALQSEWFQTWMTTLLMVLVYRRGDDGKVKVHMHVILSDDKDQSNYFVQKGLGDIVKYYQGMHPSKNFSDPDEIKLVRIVCDGCKYQFKYLVGIEWLTRFPEEYPNKGGKVRRRSYYICVY